MPFQSGDQVKLAKVLNLDRYAYYRNSRLASLMKTLEDVDAREGSNLVFNVQSNVTAIEALNTEIDTALASGDEGIRRIDIDDFYEVEYFEGNSQTTGKDAQRAALIQQIRGWLDPEDELRCREMAGNILF